MTALEYMERQAQSNRINYNRQVLRGASEKDLQNIKEKIGHYQDAVEALKKQKMIECEVVVHGKWVEEDDYFCCSKCGQAIAEACVPWFNYCPNCGARMKG